MAPNNKTTQSSGENGKSAEDEEPISANDTLIFFVNGNFIRYETNAQK